MAFGYRRNIAIHLFYFFSQKGIIIHELGHAIGFHHEQTRPDRNSHVTIMTQNIQPHTLFNFQQYSTGVINTYDVPYDYRSVMHYGQYVSYLSKKSIKAKCDQRNVGFLYHILLFSNQNIFSEMYIAELYENPIYNI